MMTIKTSTKTDERPGSKRKQGTRLADGDCGRNRRARRTRSSDGHALLELSMSIPVIVIMVVLGLNCALPAIGAWWNDAACRDAARAAAMQTSADNAKLAAAKALDSFQLAGNNFLDSPSLSRGAGDFVFTRTEEGDPDHQVANSFVTVATTTSCRLIAFNHEIKFKRSYTYPLSPKQALQDIESGPVSEGSDADEALPED